jgi:hypothetical protein
MGAIVTSNRGKDSLQVLQLPGNKIDSIATTMDLATMADLHLLHGQVPLVVVTTTAAMVVLLVVVLHHGTNRRHHRRRLRLVNLLMGMVRILGTIRALVTEHHQQQLHQGSALSCNNTLVHLRLHQVTALHHLHHPTMLLHRRPRPTTLHLLLPLNRDIRESASPRSKTIWTSIRGDRASSLD